MEILSCDKCGKEWEREIRRGKKPKYCVSCEQAARQPLPPRLCLVCGVEYIPTQTRQKYCIGRGCKQKATYRRGIKAQYYCNYCHEPFNPKASDRTDYCGRECSYNWLHKRKDERAALKRIQDNWKPNKPSPEVECEICGKVVPRKVWGKKQRLCGSRECRMEHGRRYTRTKYPYVPLPPKEIACVICNVKATYQGKGSGHRKYCDGCAREVASRAHKLQTRKRNLRLKTVRREPYTPLQIYKRDKWVCGICDKPINPKLKHPHLHSKTIDHVIPLSKGGADAPDNLQPAHLICNSYKCDNVVSSCG